MSQTMETRGDQSIHPSQSVDLLARSLQCLQRGILAAERGRPRLGPIEDLALMQPHPATTPGMHILPSRLNRYQPAAGMQTFTEGTSPDSAEALRRNSTGSRVHRSRLRGLHGKARKHAWDVVCFRVCPCGSEAPAALALLRALLTAARAAGGGAARGGVAARAALRARRCSGEVGPAGGKLVVACACPQAKLITLWFPPALPAALACPPPN